MMVWAIGALSSEPEPSFRASGVIPRIIASDVIMIGRKRVRAALIKDSLRSVPRLRSFLAKSISKMGFLETNPISIIMPMSDMMLIWLPPIRSPRMAPMIASGRARMMAKGSIKLSNWADSTKNMNRMPSTRAIPMDEKLSPSISDVPAATN